MGFNSNSFGGPTYRTRGKDCVRIHNKNETWQHFILKAMVFHILKARNRLVFTECGFENGAISDVYDFTNKRIYEIESTKYKTEIKDNQYKGMDYYILYVEEMPEDVGTWYEFLEKNVVI